MTATELIQAERAPYRSSGFFAVGALMLILTMSLATAIQADSETLAERFAQRHYSAMDVWLGTRETLTPDERYWQARLGLVRGHGENALEIAETLVAKDPRQARYQVLLAEALAASLDGAGRLRQMRVARQIRAAYESAVELDPYNVDGHYGLFLYALQAPAIVGGGGARAREQAERLEAIDPAWGAFARALLASSEGDREAGLQALALALEYDPAHEMARFRAGLLATADEQWDQARAHFTFLVEAIPLHLGAWYQLGRVAAVSEQELESGRMALERYLEAEPLPGNPTIAAALWRLGQIDQHAGDHEQAVARFRQALDLDPAFEPASEALAAAGKVDSGAQ